MFSSQVGTQTVKMQFDTGAKKNKRKHLRQDREGANLPFGTDNLKLAIVQFQIISIRCGGITPSCDGFKLHNELPIILIIRKQEVNRYVTRRKGKSKNR